MERDLLITGLGEVATARGSRALAGPDQGRVERLQGVSVLLRDGRIAGIGSRSELERRFGALAEVPRLDGGGGTLVPGFVDAHTHLPWAGSRADELAARLAGATYQEIAARGGGILSTVAATRRASLEELVGNTLARLDRILAHGTTTAEVKSGYGLETATEVRQLQAIAAAGARHPVDVVATAMPAHQFPPEWAEDRDGWVDAIVSEVLPACAPHAVFCDVFCERGVFDVPQSRRVLEAGRELGLVPRLHADEFVDSGGAELAAELGASSADHLVAVSERGIERMAAAGVTAMLLPGVSFFLRKDDFAPARRLVDAGVPVALATDYNPGSSHTPSMPFVLQLGVFRLGLSVEEAFVAATLNPAACLGLADEVGTIEEGKRADLVLLAGPDLLHLAYDLGTNPVRAVVKDGVRIDLPALAPVPGSAGAREAARSPGAPPGPG